MAPGGALCCASSLSVAMILSRSTFRACNRNLLYVACRMRLQHRHSDKLVETGNSLWARR